MGKKKGKQSPSSAGHSKERTQQQTPTQQRSRSLPQSPTQQRPQSQRQSPTQQRSQSQKQTKTQQQVSQPQQQSAQTRPRPKIEDQPQEGDAKAFVWGQQTQMQPSQSTHSISQPASSGSQPTQPKSPPSAHSKGRPATSAWGQQTQPQSPSTAHSKSQPTSPVWSQQTKPQPPQPTHSKSQPTSPVCSKQTQPQSPQSTHSKSQPTSPVWGQKIQPRSLQSAHSISRPATSAWGQQTQPQSPPSSQSISQPTSPVWGQQTQPQSPQSTHSKSQPTSPVWGQKTQPRSPKSTHSKSQPTLPVWGQQTEPRSPQSAHSISQSASPVWGQQIQPRSPQSAHSISQSASPVWGQQIQPRSPQSAHSISQSASPVWGQQTPRSPQSAHSISQSASPVWGQQTQPRSPQPTRSISQSASPVWGQQSPPAKPRPIQQKSPHSRGVSTASTLDEDIEKLSIPNPSTGSSSSQSPKPSSSSALIHLTAHKGCGTNGRIVCVDVNLMKLVLDQLLTTVYQYDVTIEPNLPKRMLPQIFETYRKTNFKDIFVAFDGQKIAVSPQILPDCVQRETKVIDENNRECVYTVEMKEARDSRIDFQSLKNYTTMRQYGAPLRALQMLEIVLKSPFLYKSGVQAGRSFYTRPVNPADLGDNYELWTGLYQATVLGSRPYLNIDIAHKAFPSEIRVIDLLNPNALNRDLYPRDRSALQTHLHGLIIRYEMPGNPASVRNFKFLGLNSNSKSHRFKNDLDKKEYTIEEYFRSRKATIRYPNLPTLKLGNPTKNITVPLEFCTVVGNQAVNKKCTENQTRNMIKQAASSTDVRKEKILDMLRRINHNECPTLKQFGITVDDNNFINVEGRILSAPVMEYKEKTFSPVKGVWRIEQFKFLKPVAMTKYAALIVDNNYELSSVRDFCEKIGVVGRQMGMHIDKHYHMYRLDRTSGTIEDNLHREMSKMIENNIELLFCIIPDRGDVYSKIKQCAELECGILTQCIKQYTITKICNTGNAGMDQRQDTTVSNILLKVNAKLNGINHKLSRGSLPPLMAKPFMLVGADVTHPSPGQENIPSVVGVVSSHDIHGFQYNKSWRLQDPKQEMISDFEEILMEHLQYFEKQRNRLPETILYFRDGVSDGQFQQVLEVELNAMYRGCQKYRDRYKPKITLIVVQKRHHTRFFPPPHSDMGREDRKNNNVPAGTIIDSEITHPRLNQFYLVSHQSIQGVARPTKYCLLRDDSDIPIDDLQAITYNLCHFFARCTRSVSYPAPTYYAHLAAARGRVYIEGKNIVMTQLDREFKKCTVKEKISKQHPMYFI